MRKLLRQRLNRISLIIENETRSRYFWFPVKRFGSLVFQMGRYFDYNATAPVSAPAREAWLRVTDNYWHNPSGLYREAGIARRLMEESREDLADMLGTEPGRIVFTSGATEANNALFAHLAAGGEGEERVAISAVEHPCVREAARKWFGNRVDEIRVTREGVVELDHLDRLLERGETALVSVMAANNETGVLQPWEAVSERCRDAGVRFHCDAAQWVGKMPLEGLGDCDFLTGSGHKFGAVKGIGFLLVDDGNFLAAVGGPQEEGRRAGTEDYAGIASMVAALAACRAGHASGRDRFEERVRRLVPGTVTVGDKAGRLWNTSMLTVPRHSNLKWLTRLSKAGFALSTGSACSAGKGNPSHVMEAMGLGYKEMGHVLRVSGGWDTTLEDWMALAETVGQVWNALESRGRSTDQLDLTKL